MGHTRGLKEKVVILKSENAAIYNVLQEIVEQQLSEGEVAAIQALEPATPVPVPGFNEFLDSIKIIPIVDKFVTKQINLKQLVRTLDPVANDLFEDYLFFLNEQISQQSRRLIMHLGADEMENHEIENSHIFVRELLLRVALVSLSTEVAVNVKIKGVKIVSILKKFVSQIVEKKLLTKGRGKKLSPFAVALNEQHTPWVRRFQAVIENVALINMNRTAITRCIKYFDRARDTIKAYMIAELDSSTKESQLAPSQLDNTIRNIENAILGRTSRQMRRELSEMIEQSKSGNCLIDYGLVDQGIWERQEKVQGVIQRNRHPRAEYIRELYELLRRTHIFVKTVVDSLDILNDTLSWALVTTGLVDFSRIASFIGEYGEEAANITQVSHECLSEAMRERFAAQGYYFDKLKSKAEPTSREIEKLTDEYFLTRVKQRAGGAIQRLILIEQFALQWLNKELGVIRRDSDLTSSIAVQQASLYGPVVEMIEDGAGRQDGPTGTTLPLLLAPPADSPRVKRPNTSMGNQVREGAPVAGSIEAPVSDEERSRSPIQVPCLKYKYATLLREKKKGKNPLEQKRSATPDGMYRSGMSPVDVERPHSESEYSQRVDYNIDAGSSDEEPMGFRTEDAAYFGSPSTNSLLQRVSSPESEESDEYLISEGGTPMRAYNQATTSTTTTTTTRDARTLAQEAGHLDDGQYREIALTKEEMQAFCMVSGQERCQEAKCIHKKDLTRINWAPGWKENCTCVKTMDELLQGGVVVLDAEDPDGNHFLMRAIIKCREGMVVYLIHKGINLGHENKAGQTAFDLAKESKSVFIQWLMSFIERYRVVEQDRMENDERQKVSPNQEMRESKEKAKKVKRKLSSQVAEETVDFVLAADETIWEKILSILGLKHEVKVSEQTYKVSRKVFAAVYASQLLKSDEPFVDLIASFENSKDNTERRLYGEFSVEVRLCIEHARRQGDAGVIIRRQGETIVRLSREKAEAIQQVGRLQEENEGLQGEKAELEEDKKKLIDENRGYRQFAAEVEARRRKEQAEYQRKTAERDEAHQKEIVAYQKEMAERDETHNRTTQRLVTMMQELRREFLEALKQQPLPPQNGKQFRR